MHDPGEHSSPVRLPFGSFPVINISLLHTDIVLQTNRAACTLFRLLSCVACKLCKPGKCQTMTVNRITIRNADHVYTVFFKDRFFSLDILYERKEKRIFVFATKQKKVLSFFFPAGISVIPALFIPGKNVLSVLASLIYLCNLLFFDYTTKVHNILYYAIDVRIFLYNFNSYL